MPSNSEVMDEMEIQVPLTSSLTSSAINMIGPSDVRVPFTARHPT